MIQLNLRITKAQLRRLQAQQQGDEQVQQTAIRLLFPYLTEPGPAPLVQPQGDDPMDYLAMDRFAAACCQAQSLASAQGRPWYVIDRPGGIAITPRIGDAVGYTNLHKFLPVNNDVLGYSTRRLCRSSGQACRADVAEQ